MTSNRKSGLPLAGAATAIAAAIMLSGCGSKSDQTVPAATNYAVPPANVTSDAVTGDAATGDANSDNLMENQQEMERHHRQAMDHDDMRRGGGNPGAPATDQAPANQAAPMKDM